MRHILLLALPLVAVSACGSSGSSSPTTTEVSTPSSTVAPATVPATTTIVPTTEALTTEAPTTTTPEREVSFQTSGQQVTPMAFSEQRAAVMTIHSEAAGDFEGSLTTELITMPESLLAIVWFEGSVADCGQGGLAIRIGTRPDGAVGWEIVPGLGVGDLAAVNGSGTEVAPRFTGTIVCEGTADPTQFSTTLLEPVPATGIEAGVPLHIPIHEDRIDVVPHPAQTLAPQMWAVAATYNTGTMLQLFMWWVLPGSTTPLYNTFATIWFLTDTGNSCGVPAVTRAILDDVEFEDYRGGWDVPANLNGGGYGGGLFDATTSVGRVVCNA